VATIETEQGTMAGARMGAEVRAEGDVARLVEAADEVARLQHRREHGSGIAGIGAQITVAQVGAVKSGAPPEMSSTIVAVGYRAVAGRSKKQARRATTARAAHSRRR